MYPTEMKMGQWESTCLMLQLTPVASESSLLNLASQKRIMAFGQSNAILFDNSSRMHLLFSAACLKEKINTMVSLTDEVVNSYRGMSTLSENSKETVQAIQTAMHVSSCVLRTLRWLSLFTVRVVILHSKSAGAITLWISKKSRRMHMIS